MRAWRFGLVLLSLTSCVVAPRPRLDELSETPTWREEHLPDRFVIDKPGKCVVS
jgi:hypothetical protein